MAKAALASDARVHFFCPGCQFVHGIRYAEPQPVWSWNGDLERPTFTPSVLLQRMMGNFLPREHPDFKETLEVCHSFVNDGRIQFLPDSTHELSGQTVELPEWPYGSDYK